MPAKTLTITMDLKGTVQRVAYNGQPLRVTRSRYVAGAPMVQAPT